MLCIILNYFFFFKQKTAYEMRISDWSSDVCSSDLCKRKRGQEHHDSDQHRQHGKGAERRQQSFGRAQGEARDHEAVRATGGCAAISRVSPLRSEEHTSELQSLMRTSYAVFCLKKNT